MNVIDKRKKEILYKAKHRGSKEIDLLIGGFVDSVINSLPEEELKQLVILLDEDDIYIFELVKDPLPELSDILDRLRAYLKDRGWS
jgi:antitoxin CptB